MHDPSNPWTSLRNELHATIDGFDAPPSLGSRLSALIVLLGFDTVVALVFTALLVLLHHRTGRSWWLCRLVTRPPPCKGAILTTNRHVSVPLGVFLASASGLCYVSLAYEVFVVSDGGTTWSRAAFAPARVYLSIFLAIAGYAVSITFVQAFFVAIEAAAPGKIKLSSRAFNSICLAAGVVLIGAMMVVSTLLAANWPPVWNGFVALDSVLEEGETAWQGTLDLALLAKAHALQVDLAEVAEAYIPYVVALKLTYMLVTVCIALLDLLGFGLVYLLHRQLKSLARHVNSSNDVTLLDSDANADADAQGHKAETSIEQLNAGFMEKLGELRRAKAELIIAISLCFVVCAELTCWNVWSLASANSTSVVPAGVTEMSLFMNDWLIGIALFFANLGLVAQTVLGLRAARKPAPHHLPIPRFVHLDSNSSASTK